MSGSTRTRSSTTSSSSGAKSSDWRRSGRTRGTPTWCKPGCNCSDGQASMKTKNLTPFLFGIAATSRRPRRPELAVIVRATYLIAPGQDLALPPGPPRLSQGVMSAETYREDDEERAGECLYPGDF